MGVTRLKRKDRRNKTVARVEVQVLKKGRNIELGSRSKTLKNSPSQNTTLFWIHWLLKQNKLRLVDYIFRIFLKSPRYARATGDFFCVCGGASRRRGLPCPVYISYFRQFG